MQKKNNSKDLKKENNTCGTFDSATYEVRSFNWKPMKKINNIVVDMLVSGASFFFVEMVYSSTIEALDLRPHPLIECIILAYATYRLIKFLRD